jgi:hypothetical protein
MKNVAEKIKVLLLLFVFGVGCFVRLWKLEYIPYAADADELAYIFAGQSLYQYGIPISWSSFDIPAIKWHNTEPATVGFESNEIYKYNKPWLDHMFFIPLWTGFQGSLSGYIFPTIPPSIEYRLPMVLLGCGSLALIFLISRKHFGFYPALGSLLLVGMSPVLFFGQRMVVSENALNFFFLLAYYLYIEKQSIWYLAMATILAATVKATGLLILPLLCFGFLLNKQYKKAVLYTAASLIGTGILHAAYALHIDWHIFLRLLKQQSFRLVGWGNPAFIFSHPGFHIRPILDFSYYVLLFAGMSIFLISKDTEHRYLKMWIAAMFVVVWITSAEQDMLGWYKLPLFSFLGIAAGLAFKERLYLPLILGILITLINNIGIVKFPGFEFPPPLYLRSVVGVGVVGFMLLQFGVIKKQWQLTILVAVLSLYLLQSVYIADQYFGALCKDKICPTPTITLRNYLFPTPKN